MSKKFPDTLYGVMAVSLITEGFVGMKITADEVRRLLRCVDALQDLAQIRGWDCIDPGTWAREFDAAIDALHGVSTAA